MCLLVTQTPLFWSQSGNAGAFSSSANKLRALVLSVLLCERLTWRRLLLTFSAADDPTDHVGAVRLGSVQQRDDRVLLVWNSLQGTRLRPRSDQTRS